MNNQFACFQGIGTRVTSWQDLDGLVKNKSNSILKHFKCAAKKSVLMGTAALAPVAFAQTASAQINQTIDASAGQSCIDAGGAIVGPNIFTAADNGTFGTGSGAPDEFVASNIFAPQVSGGTYRNSYANYSHGSFSYVSNQVTRRNKFQFNGPQIDPVYGVAGNFMVSDPSDQSPTLDHQLTGLAPGTAYEISFWVADTEYGNGAKQRIAVDIDGNQEFLTPFIDSNGNGNGDNPLVWQKHSYVYTHSNASTTALASVRFNETGASGRDVFLDNIEMRQCQFASNPSMTLTKVADDATDRSTDHAITYTYTVENTGDVNIEDVSISDDHTSAAGTVSLPVSGESGDAGNSTDSSDTTANDGIWDVLAPGDIITFTSSYTVTSADVNLGNDLTNIATVTGTPTAGAFGPDPITASESVSLFVPALYPVTPQPVGVCTVDALVYGENFDDGSNGGFSAVSQPANAPVGLLESTNNLGNINNTVTDATIHPDLNGGAGAPSPSGGGFAAAFDAQGGEPTWVVSVGTQDWSSLMDGGISFEFWNYYPNKAVSNYNDQILYFQIIGDNGKLVLDLDISTYAATLLTGNWITIEALLDTAEPWFFTTNTNVRSESGLAPATPADFATVLASVNSVAIAPESGGGGNYNAPGIDQLLNIERYGVDTIQAFSCAISANPQMTLAKVADNDTGRKLGETITYTYTAVNTGNVDINDVTVSDVHNGSGTLSTITIGTLTNTSGDSSDDSADNDIDVLAPNDSVTFEATYVVTEADVIAGADITNTATVTGDPIAGALPATPITADESVSVAINEVDISITKTNTPGVNGEVDQAADTLTSGNTTTYTLVVTNNGPDTVTSAIVTDTVGTGLTCTSTDTVTITGDGVPSGSFTIGDLTGGGITLETLADGESATLIYTCEVN